MIINIVDKKTDAIVDFIETDTSDSPPIWDDTFLERVNNGTIRFDFATHSDTSEHLVNKNKLVIQHPDGYNMCFTIENVEQTTEREIFIESEGEHLRLSTAKIIPPGKLEGATINTAADYMLNGTRWKRGITEYNGAMNFRIEEWTNPLKGCISIGNQFDVEVRFRTETIGGRIAGRYVDFLKRIGYDDGGETILGKDLIGVRRKESSADVFTAMVGVGKSSTPGEYIMFDSINGGKNYIEDKDALQRWSDDGKHLFGLWLVEPEEGEETVTPEMVKFRTEQAFADNINSKVEYEVDSVALEQFGMDHEKIRLGNTRRIKDEGFNPPLYLEARVKEIERRNLMKEVKAVYGNYKEIQINVYKELKDLQMKLFTGSYDTVKRVFSPTPPADKTVLWVDVSGQFAIVKLYDTALGEWVAAGPEVAGDLGAYTRTEIDEKYEESKNLVQAWKNPGTTEFDGNSIKTGTFSFSQARGGVIHLGQEGGGELRVFNFNQDGLAEPIGEIILEGASFPLVNTEYINAPNKLETMEIDENVYPTWHYYVHNLDGTDENHGRSTSFPKRTVQAVLNSLPRYLSGEIIIEMMGTGEDQEEDLDFKGFVGDGKIVIKSSSGYKRLAGTISLRHCTVQIIFTECALKCSHSAELHVKSETCSKVEFEGVKFLGENKADDGIRGYYSHILVRGCQFDRYKNAAITSARGNLMAVENCSGDSNKYGVWAYGGGIVSGGGTAPKGTTSQTLESNGNILPTFTNAGGTVPPDPPDTTETVTKYYDASSSGAWRENYGGEWNKNVPYQGEYNGWGRYRGLWFHGSQLSHLSGKTIKSMKIKVKRDSKGGRSGGVNVVFRTHNYTSKPSGTPSYSSSSVTSSFSWGQEKWVDVTSLKSAFQNGSAKGFAIYTSSTSNSDYAIFTGKCQVKVTYEE